jgi:hypothetical protein
VAKLASASELAKTIAAKNRKPLKSFWRKISRAARSSKAGSVEAEEKNRLWSIQTFADATVLYLDAFRLGSLIILGFILGFASAGAISSLTDTIAKISKLGPQ